MSDCDLGKEGRNVSLLTCFHTWQRKPHPFKCWSQSYWWSISCMPVNVRSMNSEMFKRREEERGREKERERKNNEWMWIDVGEKRDTTILVIVVLLVPIDLVNTDEREEEREIKNSERKRREKRDREQWERKEREEGQRTVSKHCHVISSGSWRGGGSGKHLVVCEITKIFFLSFHSREGEKKREKEEKERVSYQVFQLDRMSFQY